MSPAQAVRFLEDMRTLYSRVDEPTLAISLRVPGNVLRAIKIRAQADGKKYQSLIIEFLRQGLRDK